MRILVTGAKGMVGTALVNNLKNFIEPILIVSLAFIVGGIILAVMGPMFGLYNTIR